MQETKYNKILSSTKENACERSNQSCNANHVDIFGTGRTNDELAISSDDPSHTNSVLCGYFR